MHIVMIGAKAVPYPAGIDRYIEEVGKRLVEGGHRVTVFVRPHYSSHGEKIWKGMELRTVPSITTKHMDAISHIAVSTLYTIRLRPDIIHFHMIGASPFCLLGRICGIKTVLHNHGMDYERAKWRTLAKLYLRSSVPLSAYLPNKTLVVSQGLEKYYNERYKRNAVFIPPGITVPELAGQDEIAHLGLKENNYILFLSRLVPEKGCHYLIEAFKRTPSSMDLVIAGSSVYDAVYVEQLRKSGDPRVKFLGEVSIKTMQELYSNAYLFVQPSEIEGFPRTVQEALSYGRCVLASDIEGNKEALGECGYTFRNKDPNDLAQKLTFLMGRSDLVRAEYEKSRRRIAEHYGWPRVMARLEDVYYSLMGTQEDI